MTPSRISPGWWQLHSLQIHKSRKCCEFHCDVKDHKVEDERSASNAISGEAIENDVTERDSEQEEI